MRYLGCLHGTPGEGFAIPWRSRPFNACGIAWRICHAIIENVYR
jgi:hypothetical protein